MLGIAFGWREGDGLGKSRRTATRSISDCGSGRRVLLGVACRVREDRRRAAYRRDAAEPVQASRFCSITATWCQEGVPVHSGHGLRGLGIAASACAVALARPRVGQRLFGGVGSRRQRRGRSHLDDLAARIRRLHHGWVLPVRDGGQVRVRPVAVGRRDAGVRSGLAGSVADQRHGGDIRRRRDRRCRARRGGSATVGRLRQSAFISIQTAGRVACPELGVILPSGAVAFGAASLKSGRVSGSG